jgi:Immunity protein 35
MTKEQALDAAAAFLREIYPTAPPTIVLLPELAQEFAWAWLITFDTQEHIDTGDITQAPLSRALAVPKDGATVRWVPTPFSADESVGYLNTGQYPARLRGAGH